VISFLLTQRLHLAEFQPIKYERGTSVAEKIVLQHVVPMLSFGQEAKVPLHSAD
jgi:hypothetical protein